MGDETPIREPDHLLAPHNSVVVFIDYQPEQVDTVTSQPPAEMRLNALAVARAATAFEVPVILTTVGVALGANTPTVDWLRNELGPMPEIDRSTLNSWEDPDFRAAIVATGRRKVVMCGLWTEVCVAFPTLDLLAEGYDVFPVADAIGGISLDAHDRALQRMVQAGAQPVTAISFACELQRDWARGNGDALRQILRWYFPERQRLQSGAS